MEIRLTKEQAAWLKTTLLVMLDNCHWGRCNLDPDQKEHAETIVRKIHEKEESSWDNQGCT